jgi:16S rRNA (cytosine1402-N4)-methyltransferase
LRAGGAAPEAIDSVMSDDVSQPPTGDAFRPESRPKRRPRYSGTHPRKFHEKYKELSPERYAADLQKIFARGKTPAGMHRPIMVQEILEVLAPKPGETAVDCTLGYGGHAREILQKIQPGGRLLGIDADPVELSRTEARLRAEGKDPDTFVAVRSNFAGLPQVLAKQGWEAADLILADLGVSSMQLDNPERGFTFKASGPLDMRMNPSRGESAAQFLAHVSEQKLTDLLVENSDEPHAAVIARALRASSVPLTTTDSLAKVVRQTLGAARVKADDAELSVRRVFQALRIAVNDEFSALETFLRNLPLCLNPAGRVAVLTFHSGEDRRVKKAFQAGERAGVYSSVAHDVVRASAEETRDNSRASSAKLRWAVKA